MLNMNMQLKIKAITNIISIILSFYFFRGEGRGELIELSMQVKIFGLHHLAQDCVSQDFTLLIPKTDLAD